jgi:hypothetical protein
MDIQEIRLRIVEAYTDDDQECWAEVEKYVLHGFDTSSGQAEPEEKRRYKPPNTEDFSAQLVKVNIVDHKPVDIPEGSKFIGLTAQNGVLVEVDGEQHIIYAWPLSQDEGEPLPSDFATLKDRIKPDEQSAACQNGHA